MLHHMRYLYQYHGTISNDVQACMLTFGVLVHNSMGIKVIRVIRAGSD